MTADKSMLKKFREAASGTVFWVGIIIIGVLAIPTAVFISIILSIWTGTDFLMNKLNKD